MGKTLCNLCSLSCEIGEYDNYGLLNAEVSGGYESTPGNGNGALDDTMKYTFSLCEFCLDWLFTQFKIPVRMECYMNSGPPEPFVPAKDRVISDNWRKMKDEFFTEWHKRNTARGQ